ncbi:hypothetical protein BD310DRAFT_359639 [Dichomitus squalens]|uniref:Uncharacterized protein n=1 Tax=Dichomitus squalens TaxID=114155 RepID=A0A4Q9PZF4_9APHY|nr:hypothetical protein BD310DRAFT_359639 [Dichomitus squalens]
MDEHSLDNLDARKTNICPHRRIVTSTYESDMCACWISPQTWRPNRRKPTCLPPPPSIAFSAVLYTATSRSAPPPLCTASGPSISGDSKRQWQSNIRSRVVGSADSPNRWRGRLQKT